jgi:hypothetical protein
MEKRICNANNSNNNIAAAFWNHGHSLPFPDSSEFSAASHRTRIKVVPLLNSPSTGYTLSDLLSIGEKKQNKEEGPP